MQRRLWALVFVVACGGGDKAKFEAARDAMCACKDTACTVRVMDANKAWLKEFAAKHVSREHPLADVPSDILAVMKESDDCLHRATKAEDIAEYERTVLHPPPARSSPGADTLIAAATTAKDKMCACADKACAEKVDDDLKKISLDLMDSPGYSSSDEQTAKLEAVGKVISDCRDRATKK